MKNERATIRQLVPMPNKWEFHYLFRNGTEPEIKLERVPILGLALADFPLQNGDTDQRIVHFGEGSLGSDFELYQTCGYDQYIYPCFSDGPQTRGLGVAPVGSPDDWFEEETSDAKDQLEAEFLHGNSIRKIRTIAFGLGLIDKYDLSGQFSGGLDNFFAITSSKYKNDAGKNDWLKVLLALKKIQTDSGDAAMIQAVLRAAEIPSEQVENMRFQVVNNIEEAA